MNMDNVSGLHRVGDIILTLYPELKNQRNGTTNKNRA